MSAYVDVLRVALTLEPVPPIAKDLSSPSTVPPILPESPETTRNRWRIAGYAIAGFGLGAAVAGAVVALQSVSAADDARNRAAAAAAAKRPTQTDLRNYDQAKADFDSATNRNHIGWIVAGLGVATLAGGTALVVTSRPRKTTVGLAGPTLWAAPRAGGLAFVGSW